MDNQEFAYKSDTNKLYDIVGRTIQSDNYQITMDEFWFSISCDKIVQPFDFISVENIHNTITIGIVKELRTIRNTDDFKVSTELKESKYKNLGNSKTKADKNVDQGIRVARVAVMANVQLDDDTQSNFKIKYNGEIRMPVNINKTVRFATEKEIFVGLGIPKMEEPIMVGLIKMSNGMNIPIPIGLSYLAGPDTAHVNITGISGNMKTSYVIFLLYSIYQKLIENKDVAIILFNTRDDDLMHIHEKVDRVPDDDLKLYSLMKLSIKSFENVTYFLPRGKDGHPMSEHIPPNFQTYSYELRDIYDRLDLLLSSEIYDPRYNLYSIINYIYESWPLKDSSNKIVTNWSDLVKFINYPNEIIGYKSMYLHFLGYIQKFKRSPLFTDKRKTSIYIGNKIKNIKGGDIFVIDIAMIPTFEEQSLVVGDVMKNIDEMNASYYSAKENQIKNIKKVGEKVTNSISNTKKPKYTLIFIDEINRFLPNVYSLEHHSPVADEILKTIIAGKSRNTILLSAQQFKSTVDPILHENTGIHMIAKLGLSELAKSPYSMLDEITKANISRMNKGEIVMIQPSFQHPVKIVFPRAPFKRPSRKT